MEGLLKVHAQFTLFCQKSEVYRSDKTASHEMGTDGSAVLLTCACNTSECTAAEAGARAIDAARNENCLPVHQLQGNQKSRNTLCYLIQISAESRQKSLGQATFCKLRRVIGALPTCVQHPSVSGLAWEKSGAQRLRSIRAKSRKTRRVLVGNSRFSHVARKNEAAD